MPKIVVALGGNALQSKDSEPTAAGQLEVVKKTCEHIADISSQGYELAIVHGNGPQERQRKKSHLLCHLMYVGQ